MKQQLYIFFHAILYLLKKYKAYYNCEHICNMNGLLFLFIVIVFVALLYYAYSAEPSSTEGQGEYVELGDDMSFDGRD